MSGDCSLATFCVVISGAPDNSTEKQFLQVLQKHVSDAKLQRLKYENNSFKKWILLLDSRAFAKRVAEKKDRKFRSCKVDVVVKSQKRDCESSNSKDGPSRKIVVTGLTEVSGENLAMYLEDLFEEIHVMTVDLCDDHSTAVVELDDSRTVDMILKQQPIVIDGQTLCVDKFRDKPKCMVEVRGLKNIEKNLDALKLYFKSTKYSGGGKVVKCTTKNDTVYITFETEEVAQRVVNKKDHSLARQQLSVTMCDPDQISGEGKENQRKILLSHLPKDVGKDHVTLFLEDIADSVGIHVENVHINTEDDTAVVEFTEQIAAETILKHKELTIKEQTVFVDVYTGKKDTFRKVKATGPSDIEKEMEWLRLYFKKIGRSVGGSIVDSYCESDSAYFTFESEDVARKVVDTDHTKKGLTVTLVKEKAHQLDNESAELPSTTVRVRGVTKEINRETLSFYFESERHSGGGQIKSVSVDKDDVDTVYVCFASHTVAKRVVEREHKLEGKSFQVSLYIPLPYYDNKILIKGLKSTTSKDTLTLFLEARAGVEPVSMEYHQEEEDVVLVTTKTKLVSMKYNFFDLL